MAVSDVSLAAGMKSTLLSLQGTLTLINRTQDRLSSGRRVNSALDNPTNFFASQGHQSRANDLAVRKDAMLEAVQLVKSADAGIQGITSLIEAAKGVAQAALATASSADRFSYATTFDALLIQITQLSSDSGYHGTNLLNSQSQTIEFGAVTGTATLGISGFDATSSGLGIDNVTTGTITDTYTTGPLFGTQSVAITLNHNPSGITAVAIDGTPLSPGTGTDQYSVYGNDISFNNHTFAGPGTLTVTFGPGTASTGSTHFITTVAPGTASTSGWASTAGIRSSATQLENALSTLRSKSASLSTNLSVVTTRQDFTNKMINALHVGSDNLILADTNEEGANMLMLQARQNLGITSLGMASQTAQAVLRLF